MRDIKRDDIGLLLFKLGERIERAELAVIYRRSLQSTN